MTDDELREGMEGEGVNPSWTERYIATLAFVRAQRDAAIAKAEGHEHVVLPLAPEGTHEADIEMGERLLAVLGPPS